MKIPKAAPLIITLVAWVCWIVPLEGKKHSPNIIGASAFQWLFAILVAILIPIAVLLGLRMLATLSHKRHGLWIIYFACGPLIANLAIYGVGGILMARSYSTLTAMHESDAELVTKLTKAAQTMDSSDRRLVTPKTNQAWGIGYFILGQSFRLTTLGPIEINTFSWISMQRMPETGSLYIFDSPYTGLLSDIAKQSTTFVANGTLIEGTSTYQFSGREVLLPERQYYAYMTTSLGQDLQAPFEYVLPGYFGPASYAVPSDWTGWRPGGPTTWFDSYPEGEAFSVGPDQLFIPVTENQSRPPIFEIDFFFEVTGTPIPESSSLLFLFGFAVKLVRRRR